MERIVVSTSASGGGGGSGRGSGGGGSSGGGQCVDNHGGDGGIDVERRRRNDWRVLTSDGATASSHLRSLVVARRAAVELGKTGRERPFSTGGHDVVTLGAARRQHEAVAVGFADGVETSPDSESSQTFVGGLAPEVGSDAQEESIGLAVLGVEVAVVPHRGGVGGVHDVDGVDGAQDDAAERKGAHSGGVVGHGVGGSDGAADGVDGVLLPVVVFAVDGDIVAGGKRHLGFGAEFDGANLGEAPDGLVAPGGVVVGAVLDVDADGGA